jgi:hypothetical protein
MRQFGHVGRGQRNPIQEGPALRVGRIRVVYGKHDPVDTEGQQRGEEGRLGKNALVVIQT